MSESLEQITFINWFRANYPNEVIYAIPNGGLRNKTTAQKLKAEGVLAGVCDLHIPSRLLYIEMKRTKGGVLAPEQRNFISYINNETPQTAIVCNGWEDAKCSLK